MKLAKTSGLHQSRNRLTADEAQGRPCGPNKRTARYFSTPFHTITPKKITQPCRPPHHPVANRYSRLSAQRMRQDTNLTRKMANETNHNSLILRCQSRVARMLIFFDSRKARRGHRTRRRSRLAKRHCGTEARGRRVPIRNIVEGGKA